MSTLRGPALFYKIKNVNPSILLFIAAILAIVFANTGLHDIYYKFLNRPIVLQVGEYNLFQHHGKAMSLLEFVNDALMAVFFFVIGLEIKREILLGELASVKRALLPIIAAIGGMIVPVLVFLLFDHDAATIQGAAIPMATDIAFALAVLSLLGKRVPLSLKIFLTTLAVVDDIGGILVIATVYTSHISFIPLLFGFAFILLSYFLGTRKVNLDLVYYLVGFIVWLLFLESGVHTTISGVLLAFTIPVKSTVRLPELRNFQMDFQNTFNYTYEKEGRGIGFVSHKQLVELLQSSRKFERSVPLVQRMEHNLSPLVNYLILPLFAFVNSGVTFGEVSLAQLAVVPAGVFFGLVVGKCLGIFGFTWLFAKLKVVTMPPGMNTRNLFGISLFGGIGFTVSLFIANLSYATLDKGGIELLNQAKIGVFAGTLVSGVLGYFILNKILKK